MGGRANVILWIIGGLGFVLILSAFYNVSIGDILRGRIPTEPVTGTPAPAPTRGGGAKPETAAEKAANVASAKNRGAKQYTPAQIAQQNAQLGANGRSWATNGVQ